MTVLFTLMPKKLLWQMSEKPVEANNGSSSRRYVQTEHFTHSLPDFWYLVSLVVLSYCKCIFSKWKRGSLKLANEANFKTSWKHFRLHLHIIHDISLDMSSSSHILYSFMRTLYEKKKILFYFEMWKSCTLPSTHSSRPQRSWWLRA